MTLRNTLWGVALRNPRLWILLAVAVTGLGLAVPATAQKEAPLPSLELPATLAGKFTCLVDRSKALMRERADLRAGYGEVSKAKCDGLDEKRDAAKIAVCVNKRQELDQLTADHRRRSLSFVDDWKRIPANSGCVFEGRLRPSGMVSFVLVNFVNYCKAPKYVSLCAEQGNGQRNNLATNIDPCGSTDFTVAATMTNHCWIEGPNACPCVKMPQR